MAQVEDLAMFCRDVASVTCTQSENQAEKKIEDSRVSRKLHGTTMVRKWVISDELLHSRE